MQIVSALFVENFEMRQAPGPSTRIDLTGAMFSMAAPSEVPVTLSPHLVALIYCTATEPGNGVFEAVTYRLVRGELEFTEYGQIFAHCRIDKGPWHLVPFTLLPPVG